MGGIKKHAAHQSAIKERGAALQEDRVAHMTEVVGVFRQQLEAFAKKYRTQVGERTRQRRGDLEWDEECGGKIAWIWHGLRP